MLRSVGKASDWKALVSFPVVITTRRHAVVQDRAGVLTREVVRIGSTVRHAVVPGSHTAGSGVDRSARRTTGCSRGSLPALIPGLAFSPALTRHAGASRPARYSSNPRLARHSGRSLTAARCYASEGGHRYSGGHAPTDHGHRSQGDDPTPAQPWSPFGPVEPRSPFGPCGPAGPAGPVSPFGP
jgi:hypothetical protein